MHAIRIACLGSTRHVSPLTKHPERGRGAWAPLPPFGRGTRRVTRPSAGEACGRLGPAQTEPEMAEAKAPAPRPLSPHLQVYRWSWTMAMSVVHRITGSALYGGIALFAIWLVALASGPRDFEAVQWFFGSPLGILILFGYTWILMHH